MVNFPGPRFVLRLVRQKLRRRINYTEKRVDAYGEIRAPDQADAVLFDDALDVRHVFLPARGADHQIHSASGDAFYVSHHRGRDGEVDCHIDIAEVLRGDAFEVGVVEFIEFRADGDSALQREALDQAAHFSVTYDGDSHGKRTATEAAGTLIRTRSSRVRKRIRYGETRRRGAGLFPPPRS